jgi:hypothetical protein
MILTHRERDNDKLRTELENYCAFDLDFNERPSERALYFPSVLM